MSYPATVTTGVGATGEVTSGGSTWLGEDFVWSATVEWCVDCVVEAVE